MDDSSKNYEREQAERKSTNGLLKVFGGAISLGAGNVIGGGTMIVSGVLDLKESERMHEAAREKNR